MTRDHKPSPASVPPTPANRSIGTPYLALLPDPVPPGHVDALFADASRPRPVAPLHIGPDSQAEETVAPGRVGASGVARPASPEDVRITIAGARKRLAALKAVRANDQDKAVPDAHALVQVFLEIDAIIELLPPGKEQAVLREEAANLYNEALPALSGFFQIDTGIPFVDDGPRCGQEGQGDTPGCFLTKEQRDRLVMRALPEVVNTAMGNYKDAITETQIDLLTSTEHGWGFLAEFLFFSISGPLISIATAAITKRLAGQLTERTMTKIADTKAIQVTLQNASKGIRGELKASANGLAHDARGKFEFLSIIKSSIKGISQHLLLEAPVLLTDSELLAMVKGYEDVGAHSIPNYKAGVRDMLDRYDQSHIGDIGRGRSNGDRYLSRKQVVKVTCGRHRRWAVVESFEASSTFPKKSYDGKWVAQEQPEFVAWVDREFVGLAKDVQGQRVGEWTTLDASQETGMRAVDEWAIQNGRDLTVTPIEEHVP